MAEEAEEKDPVMEQFAELRKYVEFSHDDLSKRLDLTATRADVARLERKERRTRPSDDQLLARAVTLNDTYFGGLGGNDFTLTVDGAVITTGTAGNDQYELRRDNVSGVDLARPGLVAKSRLHRLQDAAVKAPAGGRAHGVDGARAVGVHARAALGRRIARQHVRLIDLERQLALGHVLRGQGFPA